MGKADKKAETKNKAKQERKQLRALHDELEREMLETATRLDATVDEARERVQRRVAELETFATSARTRAEQSEAGLLRAAAQSETTLRAITEDADERLRAMVEHIEAQRHSFDVTRNEVTTSAGDLAVQIRTQGARLDRAVEAELSRLDERVRVATDEQLAATTERANTRLDAALVERIAEYDIAHADALQRLEALTAEAERRVAEFHAGMPVQSVDGLPTPEPSRTEFWDELPPPQAELEVVSAVAFADTWADVSAPMDAYVAEDLPAPQVEVEHTPVVVAGADPGATDIGRRTGPGRRPDR